MDNRKYIVTFVIRDDNNDKEYIKQLLNFVNKALYIFNEILKTDIILKIHNNKKEKVSVLNFICHNDLERNITQKILNFHTK